MKDESPEPSKEIGISIGKTDEEGKVIWKNVRKGNYIVFLPNSETQIVRVNDRDETRVINILLENESILKKNNQNGFVFIWSFCLPDRSYI